MRRRKEEDESRLTLMTKFSSCFDTFYLEKRDFPVTNCDENFDGTLDWILIEGEDAFSNVFPSSSTCNTRFRSDVKLALSWISLRSHSCCCGYQREMMVVMIVSVLYIYLFLCVLRKLQ